MPDTAVPDPLPHLTREVSERGLSYLPHIPGRHGGPDGYLEVHTSSASSGPYVWIGSHANDGGEQTRHVSAANALRFADQIVEIVGTHYQVSSAVDVAEIHARIAALLEILEPLQES